MKKHLFAVLALAAVAGAGLFALAADPPTENKAPPQDSKVPAEEPKGNTGEAAAQPSAGVDGNAEFNEPSRSPAEMYARMDLAFAKFVDLSLVAEAMAKPNASLLLDVALGLAEGERVLVRNHRTGLTSEAMMAKVVKLAACSKDKATLERVAKAATNLNKPQWAKLISEAKEFAGVSRDGPMVALEKVDVSTALLMERVRKACDLAELTNQKYELEILKKEIHAAELDSKVKGYLDSLLENTKKSLAEKPTVADEILGEFLAESRQDDYRLGVKVVAHPSGVGNVVREVIQGSKAEEIQFAVDDVILSINGRVVRDPLSTRQFVMSTTGNLTVLKYRRSTDQYLETQVTFDDPGMGQGGGDSNAERPSLSYKTIRSVKSKVVPRPAFVPRNFR